jgi:hypothetical protein
MIAFALERATGIEPATLSLGIDRLGPAVTGNPIGGRVRRELDLGDSDRGQAETFRAVSLAGSPARAGHSNRSAGWAVAVARDHHQSSSHFLMAR